MSVHAHLRYFAALGLTAFIACQVVALLAADIMSSQAKIPSEAREYSRVEMILRARDSAYIQLPAHSVELPQTIEEPKLLASHLAIEIDLAEASDALAPSHQPPPHPVTIRSPSHATTANLDTPRKARGTAKSVKLAHANVAAAIQPEPDLKKSRSPVPEQHLTAAIALKAASDAELPSKAEPVRKKLARRHPTAGELVTMQLLNQI